jgi:spore coat polysaccharide biosynthesis protein SpsF
MGSRRLPGKVLKELCNHPMLWHIVERVKQVRGIEKVVVATSDQETDLPIRDFCNKSNILCFSGSESDVLDRYYQAAQHFSADPILRLTGDCPFVDPQVISKLLILYSGGQYDHVGANTGAGAVFSNGYRYPDGLDCECFSFRALERAWNEAQLPSDREHVTAFVWRSPDTFRVGSLSAPGDYGNHRWAVDNEEDFLLASHVYEALYSSNRFFLMQDILAFLEKNPQIANLNQSFIGSEGYREVWYPNETTGNISRGSSR